MHERPHPSVFGITELKARDVPAAALLVAETFPENADLVIGPEATYRAYFDDSTKKFVQEYGNFMPIRHWVAKAERKVVGVGGIYAYTDTPHTAWIDWLCTAPNIRGQGVGKQLLEKIICCAQAERYKELSLWTTNLPEEKIAQRLYEAAGFTTVFEEVDTGGVVWMRKIKPILR